MGEKISQPTSTCQNAPFHLINLVESNLITPMSDIRHKTNGKDSQGKLQKSKIRM